MLGGHLGDFVGEVPSVFRGMKQAPHLGGD